MRTGYLVIGLAVVAGGVPASLAQEPRALDHGKSAAAGIESEEGQTHQKLGSNSGISLAVPIGKIWVGPGSEAGEPIYVRRMTVREGITVVEVSTTPFMPVLPSNEGPRAHELIARPDQPAPW